MANSSVIVTGIIVAIIVIIGITYILSTQQPATSTTVTTSASTSSTTAPVTSTISKLAPVPVMKVYQSKTIHITGAAGGTVSVKGPDGVNTTATLGSGTYAKINNVSVADYNFTLATFNITNVSAVNGQTPAYGFAFEVNGQITPSISFVNATGASVHATTVAHYPSVWTSWAWIGGTFKNGTYVGGNYLVQNTWSYNASAGTMTNTQFLKPIMWIYTIGTKSFATTTSTTTAASTTMNSTTSSTTTAGYGGY